MVSFDHAWSTPRSAAPPASTRPSSCSPRSWRIVVITIAFFVAIDLTGIDLTALAVFSGALGLAVGFGLQKTFGNLIAGIILLMDRSIKPGDVIVVGESFGSVSKIGVRAVSIVTRDGKEYLIPNENLMTQRGRELVLLDRDVRGQHPGRHRLRLRPAARAAADDRGGDSIDRVLKVPKPVVWLTARSARMRSSTSIGLDRGSRGRPRQRPLGDPPAAAGSCSASTA